MARASRAARRRRGEAVAPGAPPAATNGGQAPPETPGAVALGRVAAEAERAEEAAATPAEGERPELVVDLDWRSAVAFLGAFVALVALTGLVRSVPRTAASLAVGLLLALALDPVVTAAQRRLRLPRSGAVAAVVVGFVACVVAAGVLLVPPAVDQARDLGRELPQVTADLANLPVVGDDLAEADVPRRVQDWVEELPENLAGDTTPLRRIGRSLAGGLAAATVTLLVALTALLDGERLLRTFRRLLPPRNRPRADRLARLAYAVVGRYVAGSLLVATIAGVAVLVAGLALGVPLTPLLAVWVALFNLVPQIGGAVGGVPFVLLGFTQGAGTGLACAAFFILYLQVENHLLSPLVVGQAVKLSPPATMTAALIGVSAGGVVGALLAVPLVGAAKVVYLELRCPPPSRGAAKEPDGDATVT